MASRILFNTAEQIDQTISGAYLALIVQGTGLVRTTGVQTISGAKYFYDTISFYSGVGVSGDLRVDGSFLGNIIPKTDNLYNLGSSTNEFKDLYIDGTGRIDSLHVDENLSVTGNSNVTGNSTIGGSLSVNGNSYFSTGIFSGDLTARTTSLGSTTASSVASTGSGIFGALRITGSDVPANTSSAGLAGQIVQGGGYLYVCTATNTWVRTHLTGWV